MSCVCFRARPRGVVQPARGPMYDQPIRASPGKYDWLSAVNREEGPCRSSQCGSRTSRSLGEGDGGGEDHGDPEDHLLDPDHDRRLWCQPDGDQVDDGKDGDHNDCREWHQIGRPAQ